MKAIMNYFLNKLGQPLPLIVIFTSIFLVLVFTFIVKTRPQYDLLKFQSSVEHAQYQFVRLNTTTALCLDGSPGGYYISKDGDPNKIFLFFQGGGWCYGKNIQQTLQNCYGRSKTIGGTTRHHPQQNFLKYSQGILSNYPQNNFKDWKKVYFLYCDGSGHQGTKLEPVQVKDTQLYFRGYDITTQRFQDLQKKIGLFSKASQVVVSGCSAGGLAAYQWANYIAQRVKNGKVRVVADSGIFYDAYNVHSQSPLLREQYKTLMQIVNKQIDLPAIECIKKNLLEKQKCMFAQNLIEQIKVPVFAIQGLYDEWSVQNILGIKCLDYYSQKKCTSIEKYVMQNNRRNVVKVLDEMKKNQKNGAWAPSCSVHCFTINSAYFNEKFRIPSESQNSISFAVQNWLKNSTSSHFYVDQEKWPSNKKCSGINQFV